MAGVSTQTVGRLREMTEADLPEVLAIEHRAYPYPWPADFFRLCLRERFFCRVLEQSSRVLGYAIMAIDRNRQTAHILNLCVRPESQGRGFGTRLLRHLLTLARANGARYALLEVRPSNFAARTLYQRLGFVRSGVRKDYYPAPEGREDAIIMARPL